MTETDERMIRVMNWKKPKKWISAMAVMVCVILLSGCAANPKLRKPDVALMEFPGVRWNASPEEVVKALGFTEDQILENAMEIPGEDQEKTEYDVWNLTVTDWEFMDSSVISGHFLFIRYPGDHFGLTRVQLYLEEDADMNALRTRMTEVYDEGTPDPAPDYVFVNGRLESKELNVERTEDGFPHFWYSTVTGTEVLSAEAIERYVEYAANSDAAVGRDAALAYLNAVPMVSVSCSNRNLAADLLEKSDTSGSCVTRNTVIFAADQMIHYLQRFE